MAKRPVNAPKPGEQGFQRRKASKPKPPSPSTTTRNKNSVVSNMPHPDEFISPQTLIRKVREERARRTKFTPNGGMVAELKKGSFSAFDSEGRLIGAYSSADEAYFAAENNANRDAPITPDTEGPSWQNDLGDSGVHPIYGGLNWGVKYQENWNDYMVNHAYYGTSDERDGKVYIDGSETPLAEKEVRWTSDQKTSWDAETVWQHREYITKALRDIGYSPTRGVRIAADVKNTYIEVSNYDRPNAFQPFRIPLRDLG